MVDYPQSFDVGKDRPRPAGSRTLADLRRLWRYRNLVRYLFSSDLKTEHTGTFFGFLWWLLDPILLMLVYWLLFGVIFHRSEPYFPIFILISLISWEMFARSVERSMAMTLDRSRSMRQVAFPKSAITVSITLSQIVHTLVGLGIATVGALVYHVTPSIALLGVVPVVLVEALFTLGLAFFLTTANFFFRDVAHLTKYLFRAWYFLSPGIYALSRIPDRWQGIYQLNPFAGIFGTLHAAILHQPLPAPWVLFYTAGVSVVALVAGYAVFVRAEPHFVKASG